MADENNYGQVPESPDELLKSFKCEPLTVDRLKDLVEHGQLMDEQARDGQFGFQVLMMHPEGHIQMVHDIVELAKFWLKENK